MTIPAATKAAIIEDLRKPDMDLAKVSRLYGNSASTPPSQIFAEQAPRHWAAGLPVIPLRSRAKNPAINKWSDFCSRMPTTEEQQDWIERFPAGNIGLPLGAASGLVALDIDTKDPAVQEAIEEYIPTSPWKRVGAKGYAAIYQFNGEKTFRIKDSKGSTICELLSSGSQVVLPPSVHPDTGAPYTANCLILDIFSKAPILPNDFEGQLRLALSGYVDLQASTKDEPLRINSYAKHGGRDVKLTNVAGHYAHCVCRGEMTLAEAMAAISGFVETSIEQSATDPITPDEAVDKLFRFVRRDAKRQGGLPEGWNAGLSNEVINNLDLPTQTKPVVIVAGGRLVENIDTAEEALIAADLGVFQRGDMVVRASTGVVPTFDGKTTEGARLIPVSTTNMVELMMRAADFKKYSKNEKLDVPINCPREIADGYLARAGQWNLPVLSGVINAPTLRPDGSILDAPGYDEPTRILFEPVGSFGRVPENPSREEAAESLKVLLDLLSNFPFVGRADQSVALSMILSAIIRHSLPTAPMHATSAPSAGTGKSLLVDLASLITTGHEAAVISQGRTEEELEKRLGAQLLAGDNVIAIDNIDQPLGGAFLCTLLTQQLVKVRPLGTSKTVSLPTNATLTATGNNLTIIDDMTRRILVSRLDAERERPELRCFDFDPRERIKSDRSKYVIAALTILRSFIVAKAKPTSSPLGSFTEWSNWVRSALIWLGEVDPCETMEMTRKEDPVLLKHVELITCWWECFRDKPTTIKQVIDAVRKKEPLNMDWGNFVNGDLRESLLAVAGVRGNVDSGQLGRYLRSVKGRIVHGFRFGTDSGSSGGSARWVLTNGGIGG